LAKEAKRTGISLDDAKTLLNWADEYKMNPALNHTIPPYHGPVGPHIRVGSVNHIPVKKVP